MSEPVASGAEGMPLKADVRDRKLVIEIGVETLAWAFEHSEGNNPYNENSGDFEREVSIADPDQFAEDVCVEINREGEDGSSPLTRFLDSMTDEAVNQGSLGIADDDLDDAPIDGWDSGCPEPRADPKIQT